MADLDPARTPEFCRLEVADGVGTIRLDRPKMNALNVQVQEEIRAAATEAATRDDVKAVVVWGGERVFAAGADIKEMNDMSYTDMVKRSGALQSALGSVARIPKPVVAAVNGYALGGGCELALCADLRFAAEDAVLGQPEILLGVIPGAGGTQRLSRLVGPSKAKDVIFTGRFVKADEAHAIGMVDRVIAPAAVYDEAVAWAGQFAGAASVRRPGGEGGHRPGGRGRPGDRVGDGTSAVRGPVRHRGPQDRYVILRREAGRARPRSWAGEQAEGGGHGEGGDKVKAATFRTRLAQVVWLVCVVAALLLALGALCIALDFNQDNSLVKAILDGADAVDFGVFSRTDGVKQFSGENKETPERARELGPRSHRLADHRSRSWTGSSAPDRCPSGRGVIQTSL